IMLHVLFGREAPDPGAAVRAAVRTALAATNRRIWAWWTLPIALPIPWNRHLRQARYTLETFVAQQIAQRRQPRPGPPDLITRLMAVQDADTGETMRAPQLRDEILTLWIAGQTTMAASLAWTWLLVCHHPVIESRLREEACHAPWDGLSTASDLRALPYTRLV